MPDDKLPFIDVSLHGRLVGSIGRRCVPHLLPSLLGSFFVHVLLVLIAGAGGNFTFSNPPVEQGTASVQCVASMSLVSAEPTTVVAIPVFHLSRSTPQSIRLESQSTRPVLRVDVSAAISVAEWRRQQSTLATSLAISEPVDVAAKVQSGSRKEHAQAETVPQPSRTDKPANATIDEQQSRTRASTDQRRDLVSTDSPPPLPVKVESKKDLQSATRQVAQTRTEPTTKPLPPEAKEQYKQPPPTDDASKSARNVPSSVDSNAATGSQVDQLPRKFVSNAAPPYPAEAILARQEGRVVLRVEIGADGRVLSIRVHRSSNVTVLDRAALKTVQSWRFEPARAKGKPVPYVVAVPIRFRLGQRD